MADVRRAVRENWDAAGVKAGDLVLERVVIHTIEDNTFRAVLKLLRADQGVVELDARPSDAIALALRTGSGIWMLEEVVADASIAVDAEADEEEKEDFRRFLDRTSPAALIRHLRKEGGAALANGSEEEGKPDGEASADGERSPDEGGSPEGDSESNGGPESPTV